MARPANHKPWNQLSASQQRKIVKNQTARAHRLTETKDEERERKREAQKRKNIKRRAAQPVDEHTERVRRHFNEVVEALPFPSQNVIIERIKALLTGVDQEMEIQRTKAEDKAHRCYIFKYLEHGRWDDQAYLAQRKQAIQNRRAKQLMSPSEYGALALMPGLSKHRYNIAHGIDEAEDDDDDVKYGPEKQAMLGDAGLERGLEDRQEDGVIQGDIDFKAEWH